VLLSYMGKIRPLLHQRDPISTNYKSFWGNGSLGLVFPQKKYMQTFLRAYVPTCVHTPQSIRVLVCNAIGSIDNQEGYWSRYSEVRFQCNVFFGFTPLFSCFESINPLYRYHMRLMSLKFRQFSLFFF